MYFSNGVLQPSPARGHLLTQVMNGPSSSGSHLGRSSVFQLRLTSSMAKAQMSIHQIHYIYPPPTPFFVEDPDIFRALTLHMHSRSNSHQISLPLNGHRQVLSNSVQETGPFRQHSYLRPNCPVKQ